ncbi:hypothetical protein QFZ52_001649 [Arthrobacter woluwensis]|uniref:AvrD family protein n=1 Tax=Arthrobacter woluwensis TaxID=156980 RepID=UPI002781AC9C|nr:AvrD family protein [Arthrobacter woluwensis]MDQ0708997.1 hypothetical protein [Arthrobacter woluwensis]
MGEKPGGTSLDDELGPAEDRYFGGGYRQVEHELTEAGDGDGRRWRGRVTYPARWSVGADGRSRRPHLSSVDAVVLPMAALAGNPSRWAAAAHAEARFWIRTVKIRAGSEPWSRLADVPVTLETSRRSVEGRTLEWCSARVGNMTVELGLAVAGVRSSAGVLAIGDLEYKGHSISSSVEAFDGPDGGLRSRHLLPIGPASDPAAAQASAIDFLVTMGQLAQALVYRADATDRSGVDNLWMRKMTIAIHGHRPIAPGAFDAVTTLDRQGGVVIDGRRLRTLRVRSLASVGVEGVADLAYFTEG